MGGKTTSRSKNTKRRNQETKRRKRETKGGTRMNEARRTKIRKAVDILEESRDEEIEARDNLPENLENSRQADNMDTAIDCLVEAIMSADEAITM